MGVGEKGGSARLEGEIEAWQGKGSLSALSRAALSAPSRYNGHCYPPPGQCESPIYMTNWEQQIFAIFFILAAKFKIFGQIHVILVSLFWTHSDEFWYFPLSKYTKSSRDSPERTSQSLESPQLYTNFWKFMTSVKPNVLSF